jgi:hypothetical protein
MRREAIGVRRKPRQREQLEYPMTDSSIGLSSGFKGSGVFSVFVCPGNRADLEAALEQFREIATDLGTEGSKTEKT